MSKLRIEVRDGRVTNGGAIGFVRQTKETRTLLRARRRRLREVKTDRWANRGLRRRSAEFKKREGKRKVEERGGGMRWRKEGMEIGGGNREGRKYNILLTIDSQRREEERIFCQTQEKRKKEEQTDKTNASISAENMEKLHFSMGITRTHSIRSHALYMKFYKNSLNTN